MAVMRISTVEQMRRLDQRSISEFGLSDHLLMENAGEAVYYEILHQLGIEGQRFLVVSGPGNNGGDGFVVARKLHSSGARVRVLVFADVNAYRGAAAANYEMIRRSGVTLLADPPPEQVADSLAWCDVVVDGLLGTGLTRDVDGRFREVIEQVNSSGHRVVAVDIPSGVDGDTGQVRGTAVEAERTVTFGLPKRGNLLPPGAGRGGQLVVTHISFPPRLIEDSGISVYVNHPPRLPEPQAEGDGEGSGSVLLVVGSHEAAGEGRDAARAVLGSGGGAVRLAIPGSAASGMEDPGKGIELAPQEETDRGALARGAEEVLAGLGRAAVAVVLGPGPGIEKEHELRFRRLMAGVEVPLFLGGGAASDGVMEAVRRRSAETVWLLRPGELSRLTGLPDTGIQEDPISPLQDLAHQLDALLVLTGPRILIGCPDRRVYMNLSGPWGGFSGGSGLLLLGIAAGLLRPGSSVEDAVRCGVFLYGLALERAGGKELSGTARTPALLEELPRAAAALREGYEQITADFPTSMRVI